MTKKELIEFLEPFSDEIQILVYNEEYNFQDGGLNYIIPKYKIIKNSISKLGIKNNEGVIIIK